MSMVIISALNRIRLITRLYNKEYENYSRAYAVKDNYIKELHVASNAPEVVLTRDYDYAVMHNTVKDEDARRVIQEELGPNASSEAVSHILDNVIKPYEYDVIQCIINSKDAYFSLSDVCKHVNHWSS